MKRNIDSIDYKWLTHPTGDPFSDVGGLVIKHLSEKFPDQDILELIAYAAMIYVKDWGGKLHSFFLNSTITQAAFKGPRKIEETLKFYQGLIEDRMDFHTGCCRITGRTTKLYYAGRDNYILSGSGTFINFHHGFENGLYVSKEVLIRIFFSPLGLMQLSDKIALVQSNDARVTEYFVKENCKENLASIGSGISDGVLKSEFKNPANALFAFADKCISSLKIATYDEETGTSKVKGITLNLYHFTNFGASPDVQLYIIPATVFTFYATCLHPKLRGDWKSFINHQYSSSKFKSAKFNEVTGNWENNKDKADYDIYKVWRNRVYEKLLYDQSILPDIVRWSKTRKFNFEIVEYYQIYLRNMEQKTLEKIKGLADFIVQKQDKDGTKKSITRLNGSKSSHDIRFFLLSLVAKNYKEGNKIPLITLEDYVQYLFPDSVSWREIRDLLLIAVYQKLHESQINLEIELHEEEPETTNE